MLRVFLHYLKVHLSPQTASTGRTQFPAIWQTITKMTFGNSLLFRYWQNIAGLKFRGNQNFNVLWASSLRKLLENVFGSACGDNGRESILVQEVDHSIGCLVIRQEACLFSSSSCRSKESLHKPPGTAGLGERYGCGHLSRSVPHLLDKIGCSRLGNPFNKQHHLTRFFPKIPRPQN